MAEQGELLTLRTQLAGIEPVVPRYDYERIEIPEGISITGQFTGHKRAADIGDPAILKTDFQNSDIVIVEGMNWNPQIQKQWQKIASGDYKHLRRWREEAGGVHEDYGRAFVDALYSTNARVIFLDLPKDHPLVSRTDRHIEKWQGDLPKFEGSEDFVQLVDYNLKCQTEYGALIGQRENYILTNLGSRITAEVVNNPKLAKKADNGELHVFMSYGLTHISIFNGIQHALEISGSESSIQLTDQTYNGVLEYHSQGCHRVIRGMEIDDILSARCIVVDALETTTTVKYPDMSSDDEARFVISQIEELDTLAELAEFYEIALAECQQYMR